MAGSNWKERRVVIANCSGECCALPLEMHPWVGFIPDFGVVAQRFGDHLGFHSLCSISKAELDLLAIFAIFICQTASVAVLLWSTYPSKHPQYVWRLPMCLLRLGKEQKIMSKILWEKLEVLSLKFQNPRVRNECVPLGFPSTCSHHSPRSIS